MAILWVIATRYNSELFFTAAIGAPPASSQPAPLKTIELLPEKLERGSTEPLVEVAIDLLDEQKTLGELATESQISSTTSLVVTEHPKTSALDAYQALSAENDLDEPREFVVPERRIPNFGGYESDRTKELVKNTTFITSDEILHVHPMKFLRHSPFVLPPHPWTIECLSSMGDDQEEWKDTFDPLIRRLHAIAVTESGKHVILQQAAKSCVPTCVAMLVLDHGKTPDYQAIKTASLSNHGDAMKWVTKAGLNPKTTDLSNKQTQQELLIKCLEEDGPGILAICHPTIGGHVIVLDEISLEDNTAIIREPFHGWSVTIKLDSLVSWLDHGPYFLQIIE